MNERFNTAELLTSEALAGELVRRANIKKSHLEKVAIAVNDRTLDVYVFIRHYGPATKKQLGKVFNRSVMQYALPRLEGADVIKLKNFKYYVQD